MKYSRMANRLLLRNWRPLLLFEIFYKFLMLAGFTPLLRFLLDLTMRVAGVKYLGNDTLLRYLTNPFTLIILFALLLMVVYITFFDMIAVISALDASYHNKDISFGQMLREGFFKSLRVFSCYNWKFTIYILLILPFTGILGYGSYVNSLELPGFISDYARTQWFLALGFIAAAVVMIFFSFRWAFSIHFYTLEDCPYKPAVRKSAALMKGNVPRTIVSMVFRYLEIGLGIAILAAVSAVATYLLLHFRMIYDSDGLLMFRVVVWVIYFALIAVSIIAVPVAYSLLSALYYGFQKERAAVHKESYKELIRPEGEYRRPKGLPGRVLLFVLAGLAALCFWQFTFGALSHYDVSSVKPAIVSHRGCSAEAPENSIPAFEKAIEAGVQWIELDVHQTKDGVVVVTHDDNLKRIAGVNKKIYNMTYEELCTYDVGSWFSKEYEGLRVATLEEVLALCKGRVRLQIELKPTGHEENFEQNVIDLVRAYGYQEECVLASMNIACLKTCKTLAPELETLYIMVVAVGDLTSLDYIDGFSIEETFAFAWTINRIHAANKNCYVWTVNSPKKVWKLLENNVDGILTDKPETVMKEMDAYYSNDPVRSILSLLGLPGWLNS